MDWHEGEPDTLYHKAEHRLDAGIREAEKVGRRSRPYCCPRSCIHCLRTEEAVECLAAPGGVVNPAAAPHQEGELADQQHHVGIAKALWPCTLSKYKKEYVCCFISTIQILPKMSLCVLSHVWLFVTPWTVVCQIPLSMGFSRQEYWSG